MTTNSSNAQGRSGRTLLIVVSITALITWGILLLFTRFVPPQTLPSLAFVLFLAGIALTSTLAPLIYLIRRSFPQARLATSAVSHATREATLISACIVFNLILRLLHSWSIFTMLASFGIIVVLEALMLWQE